MKNRERILQLERARYNKNPDKFRNRSNEWHKKNPEWAKKHYLENKEKLLEYGRNQARNRRIEVLTHYSNGTPKCKCCGEDTYEFLSIDHIDGGGGKHRKEIRGNNFYNWIIKNSFPVGYQVLCHNCNQAKGLYGKCPHETKI